MKNIREYTTEKKEELRKYFSQFKIKKSLVIVQVNDDPASNSYIKGKLKDCEEIGVDARVIKLSENTTQNELLNLIEILNKDISIDGFIVQMPLPKQINEEIIKKSIVPEKDVDGFNHFSKYTPATPKGIVEFLKDNNFEFKGKNAVILGRSNIVGRPMHDILLNLDMNVINLHTKTNEDDKKFYIEHADLIVVSIGKKYNIDNRYNFKKDCVVFDVGINRENGKLYGDCVPDLKVLYQSPVPGGVGLLTRLALLINLKEVCEDNGI
jgi:methylenetetrahydrofolate dehydrogenase (NADP+) / methenyltetrahydrofolate cyclohydrolase